MPTKTDLRRFNPTSRQVQTQSPRATPEAFGAGVGLALGNIAQSLTNKALLSEDTEAAKEALARAHADRQRKLENTNASIGIIQLEAALNIELLELKQNARSNGQGLEKEMTERARSMLNEFRKTLLDHQLDKFLPLMETIQVAASLRGYGDQVQIENGEFRADIETIAQSWVDSILTVSGDPDFIFDFIADRLIDIFRDAPLGPTENSVLYKGIRLRLLKALLEKKATDEDLLNNAEGAVPDVLEKVGQAWKSEDLVAAGMSNLAAGVLNAIAGPESNNAYNVMFSPGALRYFSNFSAHPNSPATINFGEYEGQPSSAAGKYMILKSTWDEAVAEMRKAGIIITDFSPASQDRVAWHIAQRYYARVTGLDLSTILSSQNPAEIANVKRHLEKKWPGLKKVTDQEFFDSIANASGTPSSLLYDDAFTEIPYSDRVAIIEAGLLAGSKIRSKLLTDVTLESNRLIEDIYKLIAAGGGSEDLINNLGATRPDISQSKIDGLMVALREKHKEAFNIRAGYAALNAGSFDGTTPEGQDQAAAIANQEWVREAIANRDTETMDEVVTLFNAMNYIPGNLVNNLRNLANSQKSADFFFAYDILDKLRKGAPSSFLSAFGKDIETATFEFGQIRDYFTADELQSSRRNSPENKVFREHNESLLRADMSANPDKYSIPGIFGQMGFDKLFSDDPTSIDLIAGMALMAEWFPVYKRIFMLTSNHSLASKGAKDKLGPLWGTMIIGTKTIVMKFPPAKFSGEPVHNGGFGWMVDQAAEILGIDPSKLLIQSDPTTEAQYGSNQKMSWRLSILDENLGSWRHAKIKDTVTFMNNRGKVDPGFGEAKFRWWPKLSDEMRNARADAVFSAQELAASQYQIDLALTLAETSEELEAAQIRSKVLRDEIKVAEEARFALMVEEWKAKVRATPTPIGRALASIQFDREIPTLLRIYNFMITRTEPAAEAEYEWAVGLIEDSDATVDEKMNMMQILERAQQVLIEGGRGLILNAD